MQTSLLYDNAYANVMKQNSLMREYANAPYDIRSTPPPQPWGMGRYILHGKNVIHTHPDRKECCPRDGNDAIADVSLCVKSKTNHSHLAVTAKEHLW